MQENTNIVPKETLKRPSQENNREPILKYLCIYTLKLGQKEDNRHEQILYYGTPENGFSKPQQQEGQRIQTVPLDTQLRQVGLAQAMMNFSKIFSPQASCDNVHSKKARLVFFEPEPGYHMLLSVALGVRVRASDTDAKSSVVDYLDRELSDAALDRVLKTAYYRFRLGHGPLDLLFQKEGLEKLLQSLVTFFDGYIGSELILENLDVVASMDGLSILPVTKHTFLQVQTTLKTLHTSFSSLEAVGLIHLGQLVWSGTHLPTDAVRFLTSLSRGFPNPVKKPANRNSFFSSFTPFFFSNQTTTASPGSEEISQLNFQPEFYHSWDPKSPFWGQSFDQTQSTPFRTLYLGEEKVQCGVFQCWQGGFLALFFSGDSSNIISELDLYLQTQSFGELESQIKKDSILTNEREINVDSHYRYAHFNGMNLAIHARLPTLPPEVQGLLLDLQSQASRLRPVEQSLTSPLELLVRTAAAPRKPAFWVGARLTQDSALYFVIHRDASLAEIEDDITNISNEYFTSLFLS